MGEGPSAFILGAGLGTRLRPLTESLPKPLVPVWNRPLLTYAMDHLISDLGVSRFLINTHHCPEAYDEAFPEAIHQEVPITFRHEPTLLDTAGGLDNIRDWLPEGESIVLYNGDILTDLPLKEAWEHHRESGNLVTLILRSEGDELRVGFDATTNQIIDLRGALRPEWKERFQFTGIYFVSPQFLGSLEPGKIESIVLPMLRAIEAGGKIGGFVADQGSWSDLGERDSYLEALETMQGGLRQGAGERIDPASEIDLTAKIDEYSSVGESAMIGAGAVLNRSVIWPGARVAPGAQLDRVVIRGGGFAEGHLTEVDH